MCVDSVKILIVEDSQLTIKILEHILSKEGYRLTIAKDGLQAIEIIPELRPDIVLTDVQMPYKGGFEVINFVKQYYKEIPIMVVSAYGDDEGTITKAFDLGLDDLISKPFNPKELLLRIKRLLINKTIL
ncbi:response regulator [Galbibacter sp. EGI 63066]|uniref:response regulator n=1 Tax=Galbibacter sp. EGI 63066 TaxID=2993559 RepID=UPI00224913BF|nr:response regulator [Galbibacter sp. EGI 63066]MCX2678409.1 response regulator [Galbibacter sp. EGI 63066]